MRNLVNGQCAHRWRGMDRCLNLAITARPIETLYVIYDIPLCKDHAQHYDQLLIKPVI